MSELKTSPRQAPVRPEQGSPDAERFSALYADSRDDLYAYLAYLTADIGLAEELTAAAFERAFRKRGLFKPSRGDLRGWLFAIARNLAIDALRQGARETALDLLPEIQSVGDDQARTDTRVLIADAMRRLHPRDRELIALKFFAGLDNIEIAKVMKISRSNAGTQLHRAMAQLREVLTVRDEPRDDYAT